MTKILFKLLLFILFSSCSFIDTKSPQEKLLNQMSKIEVDTILLLESQSIDYYSLWSPNSDFVAVNVEGEWIKIKIENLKLFEEKWNDRKIGIVMGVVRKSSLSDKEKKTFLESTNYGGREVTTSDGSKILLDLKDLSTSMIMVKKDHTPVVLWKSKIENCHSLSLSKNEVFVSYICELNGLFLMRLK